MLALHENELRKKPGIKWKHQPIVVEQRDAGCDKRRRSVICDILKRISRIVRAKIESAFYFRRAI